VYAEDELEEAVVAERPLRAAREVPAEVRAEGEPSPEGGEHAVTGGRLRAHREREGGATRRPS